ncbi:MAG: EF-P beta-lysylation protein EpmB [Sulfuricaulis sp.]|nr:EF-P beta-lysylation protein EpmB [Sulfuricaulis sp.]
MARAITDPAELLAAAGLGHEWLPAARAAAQLFPLRVPRGFVARMGRGDPHDPLLRQVLPLAEECLAVTGFGADPVGDLAAMAAPGVLHKYHGRVLLTATGACAVHCRYCFRRHFPYADANPLADRWNQALAYIAADDSIVEVILSGGDPLTMSDRRLAELVHGLEGVGHLRRLRLHTRLPIVLPERVNDELLGWLGATRLKTVVVVHANHAQEIDASVASALARLKAAGIELFNQSVLLRGVNDSADVLAALSEVLFAAGVMPYYLHMLDRVQGAAHFEVPEAAARRLVAELNRRLPGYLVPRLVREIAGAPGKVPVI